MCENCRDKVDGILSRISYYEAGFGQIKNEYRASLLKECREALGKARDAWIECDMNKHALNDDEIYIEKLKKKI